MLPWLQCSGYFPATCIFHVCLFVLLLCMCSVAGYPALPCCWVANFAMLLGSQLCHVVG